MGSPGQFNSRCLAWSIAVGTSDPPEQAELGSGFAGPLCEI